LPQWRQGPRRFEALDLAHSGHGHRSGNIRDETVTLMVIELDVTPSVDQPCRFK
jgi:hypothetical protein